MPDRDSVARIRQEDEEARRRRKNKKRRDKLKEKKANRHFLELHTRHRRKQSNG